MYPQQAQFTTSETIIFAEAKRKPLNLRRLQAGMFTDRPDLWRKPPKRYKAPPLNQIPMFLEANPAYEPT